jgi:hypothetical protein
MTVRPEDLPSYTPLKIEAIEKETKSFQCPACKTHLQFLTRIQVVGVHETLTGEQYKAAEVNKQIPSKKKPIEFVEQAKRDGIFAAFAKTVQAAQPYNIPVDLEKYFVTFLTRATKIKTPQFAIRQCLPEDERAGELELYAFQNTAGVVKDGYLRTFLPYQLVQGKEMPSMLTPGDSGITPKAAEMSLPLWVKTRNGYVTSYALFSELRGRAAGSFANTGI